MKSEFIKNEVEKLEKDKQAIDTRVSQLTQELKSLEKQSDVLSGAIQTCQYLISVEEGDENTSVTSNTATDKKTKK
tara:strand:+ start:164 stop:391 length:228 start_codon:yes stop_codon:yes gene_type:complete